MTTALGLILLTGAYPLWLAWRANRRTSLCHAVFWLGGAWLAWLGVFLLTPGTGPEAAAPRYLALCLTGCAGIAVLGARRPGMSAWNFVVIGLFSVFLLPLAVGLGALRLSTPPTLFLAGILAVGIINYLPTRLAPAALILAVGCAVEMGGLVAGAQPSHVINMVTTVGRGLLAACPWVAWAVGRRNARQLSGFDRIWLSFRDRFGLVWGQRMREQFHRSAANAGWQVGLGWQGLRPISGATTPVAVEEEATAMLRALLKRFGENTPEKEQAHE